MPLVHLNIGGVRYSTSMTTMTRDPNSMLTVMIRQDNEKTLISTGQEIFIDRNGKIFEYVLDYLRNGSEKMVLPKDEHFLKKLLNEADFYQLSELVEFLKMKLAQVKNRQPVLDVDCFVKFNSSVTSSIALQEYLDMMNDPNYVDVKFGPDIQGRLKKVPCFHCHQPAAQKLPHSGYLSPSTGNKYVKLQADLLAMWGVVCSTTETCCLVKFIYPSYKSAVVLRETTPGILSFGRETNNHILLHIPILFLEKL